MVLYNQKGGDLMATSEAKKRANEKYQKKNRERISLILPIGIKDRILSSGETLNGFTLKAIEERLNKMGL